MNEHVDALSTEATNTVACNESDTTALIEEWRSVIGYEGLYEVSNLGLVRSIKCGNRLGRILKASLSNSGYFRVRLYSKDGYGEVLSKPYLVHRLVADAFLAMDVERDYIDHINGIKTDNRSCNLRRCTQKENMQNTETKARLASYFGTDAFRANMQLSIPKALAASRLVRQRKVQCIETEEIFESLTKAAEAFGIKKESVYTSCKSYGNAKKHVNNINGRRIYHFRYIE